MKRALVALLATSSVLGSGCAIPKGSMARPVQPVGEGGAMISAGGLVPFAAAGATSFDNDALRDFSTIANQAMLIPAAAFDYAFGERTYFGAEVSVIAPSTFLLGGDGGSSFTAVFVNPRFETSLSDNISFTIDGNIAWFTAEDSSAPLFAPAFGLRFYLPTGFGGLVWSQQLSTAFVTVALPGSLAYDIPIPIGNSTLHLFPELRYDPTFVILGDSTGVLALFSGGLTFMLEL